MMKKTATLILCEILAAGMLCACGTANSNANDNSAALQANTEIQAVSENELIQSILASSTPAPNTANATTIALTGSTAAVSGSGVTTENGVVTITDGGVYVVSGTLSEGRIMVNAPKQEVSLVLQNANITCSYGSPLYVYQSSQTLVYLPSGTQNTLTDGYAYTFNDTLSSAADEEPNACFYSKADLVVAGNGTLAVHANYHNGITSKDTLKIEESNITVTANNHGINGKDCLILKNADITVTSGGDALRSTNTADATLGYAAAVNCSLQLNAGEDGIQTESNLTVYETDCTVTAGGGSQAQIADDTSAKGLKAGKNVTLYSGRYTLNCADDAVHANGSVSVAGGSYTISTGDDGIHADENVTVANGEIEIENSFEGIEGATVSISGGNIRITSSDDGINAAGGADQSGFGGMQQDQFGGNSAYHITISEGNIEILAGGDGLDSNGDLNVSGGTVTVFSTSIADDQPLDTDGTISITGGTVFAAGSSAGMGMNLTTEQAYVSFGSSGMGGIGMGQGRAGMQQPPANGEAPNINGQQPPANNEAPNINGQQPPANSTMQGGNALIASGSSISIQDDAGNTVYSGTAPCQINYVMLCSAQLNNSGAYTLFANNNSVSTATAANSSGNTQRFS